MQSRTIRWLGASMVAATAFAPRLSARSGGGFQGVPAANPKVAGVNFPNVLTTELMETLVARGNVKLENGTATFPYYGFNGDLATLQPLPGAVQSPGNNVEATKTEPDKNTYLVLSGLHGADANYNYGTHFLFQGHENGVKDPVTGLAIGSFTRINLDADAAHRVTLLATQDSLGRNLLAIDGSTWNPFAQRLLFTSEAGTSGGVYQATPDVPCKVEDLFGVFGRGGFEGIQVDGNGSILLVEDVGGAKGAVNKNARQPNSFIYRLIPANRGDLTQGGVLQVLQVESLANPGQPIVFHAGQADQDILSQDVKDLHTYGLVFPTHWVAIHDTAVDGFASFDANALAKAKLGTPFKRPENAVFRPGTKFKQFVFTETGDTSALTEAGSAFGGFGSLLLWTKTPRSETDGALTLFFLGDVAHTGLDNITFFDADTVLAGEDGGDTLHDQRVALDSIYAFDLNTSYGAVGAPLPTRLLALGRDASSTIDSGLLGISGNGFQNDGDNETTGIHVSDGDPTPAGLLGGKIPAPFTRGWRFFYTQQHGDNSTFEILPSGR